MKKYSKALVAASGVLVALGEACSNGSIDAGDVMQIAGAVAVAIGVWGVRNAPAKEA